MIICIGAGGSELKPLITIACRTYEAELLELRFDQE
jgi:hypothetical protein